MQLINTPGKLVLPFANAGAKNTIPTASQIGITAGAASLVDGFPPLTRTPIAAGGVPPSGLDMNGILFQLSAILRWANAGGGYAYDAAFATDPNVGGYPKGARVLRSDGAGYWLNTVENNTTDPEAAGAAAAGWVPDFTNGVTSVAMASANVTLTPLQYGKPIIVITGTLTANLNLIFPNIAGEWSVINNTTGAFTITCKTAAGTGVVAPQAGATIIYGDATNIGYAFTRIQTPAQFANTMDIATTAFVQRALGNMAGGVDNASASVTLTAADVGKFYTLSSASAQTATLPLISAVPDGATILFHNPSSPIKTIQRQGADQISPDGSFITSVTLLQGEVIEFVKQASVWRAYGTGALKYSAGFGASLTASGYQKLPSGLIIQWGEVAVHSDGTNGGSTNVTFPIAFSAIAHVVACKNGSGIPGADVVYAYRGSSLTGFTAVIDSAKGDESAGTRQVAWIAIGY